MTHNMKIKYPFIFPRSLYLFSVSQCGICIPHCEICIPHCGFCISQCETENMPQQNDLYTERKRCFINIEAKKLPHKARNGHVLSHSNELYRLRLHSESKSCGKHRFAQRYFPYVLHQKQEYCNACKPPMSHPRLSRLHCLKNFSVSSR